MEAKRTACEECRKVKERCSFPVDDRESQTCCRCQRLGKPCFTAAKSRTGRPRKLNDISTVPRTGAQFVWSPCDIPPSKQAAVPKIAPRDMVFMEFIFRESTFVESFTLDPVFSQRMLTHLFESVHIAPAFLSDVFVACGKRYFKIHFGDSSGDEEIAFENSARAVRALRKASEQIDLVIVLTLGLGIITFDLMTSGLHAHEVCRFTLFAASTLQTPSVGSAGILSGLYLPFYFLDAFNCIIKRQIPVTKGPNMNNGDVDQYMGVCAPLLPHLYKMCAIGHSLKHSTSPEHTHQLKAQLTHLEHNVRAWTPSLPAVHSNLISPRLSRIMVMQARIHRAALLLVIHRLQHPFGTSDSTALGMARNILSQIDTIYEPSISTSPSNFESPPSEYRLNFPFLVAAVEIMDEDERQAVLNKASTVVSKRLYNNLERMLEGFLEYVWMRRDGGGGGVWFDWVAEGPPVVIF